MAVMTKIVKQTNIIPIPGIAECCQLMEQYGMLPNIRAHSLVVAQVADQLVRGLKRANPEVDLDRKVILAGALLHDIAKTICLDGSCLHDEVGAAICREHGYPEIALIVEEHVIRKKHEPERYAKGTFFPHEIVYYADKRVNHSEIVSLNERFAYIMNKYGHDNLERSKRINFYFEQCRELEYHLFAHLDLAPHQLGKL